MNQLPVGRMTAHACAGLVPVFYTSRERRQALQDEGKLITDYWLQYIHGASHCNTVVCVIADSVYER